MAVLQYVERELLNHNRLLHPHIVQFREVRDAGMPGQHHCIAGMAGPHLSWGCPRRCACMPAGKQQWLCKCRSIGWQHFTAGCVAQAFAQLEVPHVSSMQACEQATLGVHVQGH